MKAAVIDLGTNTFHLLIAEGQNCLINKILHKETIDVKLGEGGITKGILTEPAMHRGIAAMKKFKSVIDTYKIKNFKAVATAAVRTADNGKYFVANVKSETGIDIGIIDGDVEAELIFEGVKQAVKLGSKTCLIMDIGGGSVEFILANSDGIIWKKSYPIGAAKLMALFHHSDPIDAEEIKDIKKYLDDTLQELKNISETEKPKLLIGSSGSFETFAELVNRKKLTENLDDGLINIKLFGQMGQEILESTHKERVANPGIIPVRVDMIVVSAILTQYIIVELKIEQIQLSNYALKEGLLCSLLK